MLLCEKEIKKEEQFHIFLRAASLHFQINSIPKTMSLENDFTNASGSFLSWSISIWRSPPEQYSKITQRWFLVSYQL